MGKFKKIDTTLEGLFIIEPTQWVDERGYFMESYSKRDFEELGISDDFVQDNHSKSAKGVLRGMHFQKIEIQSKLIRVINGKVLDVVVDLRPESKSFGKYYSTELSKENQRMLYVPGGFAHGFLTLEDETEFLYRCSAYYYPKGDCGIAWNDPNVNIDWQLEKYGIADNLLIISEKDMIHKKLNEINIDELWK